MEQNKKKTLGISRTRYQAYSAAKLDRIKKKNRFKLAGKKEQDVQETDLRDSENGSQGASTSRHSTGQESSVQYSRSLQLYDEAKEQLNQVLSLRKKIAIECKARMTAFKESDTRKLDQNICRLSEIAVKHILLAQKHLNQIRKFKGSSDVEEKYFRNMEKSLSQEIREASKHLRFQEKQYFDRLKAYEKHTCNIDIQLSEAERQKMKDPFEESEGDLSIQKTENQERNKQLQVLVRSIQQLTTVYKHLNDLVIEQGSIIDRIDVNIEQTFQQVQKANDHLRGAEEQASSPYAEKCMLCLLAAILIVAVVLGFKYSHR